MKWPARFNYNEVKSTTFVKPAGENQFVREDVFTSEPIRRLVVAMCPNGIFSGEGKTNPFQFLKHNLTSIRIVRNGTAIVDYDTTDNQQVY